MPVPLPKRLRTLLINPGFVYQNPFLQVTEPLGLLYIAGYLRRYSIHHVGILDCLDSGLVARLERGRFRYGLSNEETAARIRDFDPDVIGITCLFSKKKEDFIACTQLVRRRFPNVKIVAGGTYPTLFSREIIENGWADFCIIGEGEETFHQLLDVIGGSGSLFEKIEGLMWKENGRVRCSPKENYIENLDRVPFPARDLIHYEGYVRRRSVLHGLGLRRSASLLTSRSCPNRCNFCSMHRIHGPRWRGRSAEDVLNEIGALVDDWGIEELFIMDDNFTLRKQRVLQICEGIRKNKWRLRWNTPNGISINALDRELLTAMKASGCRSICIAIESGDEKLRNEVIGKRLSDRKIEAIVGIASDLGIFVTAFYIIGMPGETRDRFERTLNQIQKLPLNGVAAAFANPLPGTRLYSDCMENRWTLLEGKGEKNEFYRPFITTGDFDESDLLHRERLFYRTFIRSHWTTLIKDTLLLRNLLLYPPFLLRIVLDRLLRFRNELSNTGGDCECSP